MGILILVFSKCYDSFMEDNYHQFSTVSEKEVQNFLSQRKSKSSSNYILDVDVNQLKREMITNSDQQLTVVPIKTKDYGFESRLVLLKINNKIESTIIHFLPTKPNSKKFSGELVLSDLEGNFFDIMWYKNGLKTHRLDTDSSISKKTDDNAECRSLCGHQASYEFCNCNTQNLTGGTLPTPPKPYISISTIYPQNLGGSENQCEDDCNEWNPGPGAGGDSSQNNTSNCGPNEKPSMVSKSCDCIEGYIRDRSGECVKKPCEGNPIIGEVKIAAQKGKSGAMGAMFGNSSNGGCVRYGGSDCTGERNKKHDGIDIESNFGTPIYAMYDGFIYSTKHDSEGAGYYTRIQSTINGETILISYFHLQKDNRILESSSPLRYVKAGEIIGYQGDSGNLKDAVAKGTVDSHLHIEVRKHNGGSNWGYKSYNLVDPRSYLNAIIDDKGNTTLNSNCN